MTTDYTADQLDTWDHDRLVDLVLRMQQDRAADKREIERLSRIGGDITKRGGTMDLIQQERDAARAWREQSETFFSETHGALIHKTLRQYMDHHQQTAQLSASYAQNKRVPVVVDLVEYATAYLMESVKAFADTLPEPVDPLQSMIFSIVKLSREDIALIYSQGLRYGAWSFSYPTEYLAFEMVHQWETTGSVDTETIRRLCDTWPGAPKADKLGEALRVVWDYEHRPNDQAQAAYCDLNGIAQRTLQEHIRRVSDLRTFATSGDYKRLFGLTE